MQLQGSFDVKASRPEAYRFLLDPNRLGPHLPDVEGIEVQDENNFTVKAKVGISHLKGTMVMKLTVVEKEAPVRAKLAGRGSGMGSVVDMTTEFKLEEATGGTTRVHWNGDATIGGKIASLGGGLMERLAKKNLERFVAGIQAGMEGLVA